MAVVLGCPTCLLVSWAPVVLVSWFPVHIVPWPPGSLVPWFWVGGGMAVGEVSTGPYSGQDTPHVITHFPGRPPAKNSVVRLVFGGKSIARNVTVRGA